MDRIGGRVGITFIIPTLNRRQWVKRAVDSCLVCENDFVKPHVVVIESHSDDGTFEYLQEIYAKDDRVTLRQNSRTVGCTESWLQGAELARTALATFVFDDDVLSPFFKDMVAHMVRESCDFVMGFGQVCRISDTYCFKPVEVFHRYPSSDLLFRYFSRQNHLELPRMPVSPICCVVTSELLHEWILEVRKFAGQNPLRRYFMLERGIGPDLMVYLAALLREHTPIVVTPSMVAQFSAHPESITIRARAFDLAVGYWLAKIWAIDRRLTAGDRKGAARCAAYLLLYGVRLLLTKVSRLETSWVLGVGREIWLVCARIFKARVVWHTFAAALVLAGSEIRQGRFPLVVK